MDKNGESFFAKLLKEQPSYGAATDNPLGFIISLIAITAALGIAVAVIGYGVFALTSLFD